MVRICPSFSIEIAKKPLKATDMKTYKYEKGIFFFFYHVNEKIRNTVYIYQAHEIFLKEKKNIQSTHTTKKNLPYSNDNSWI